MTFLMRRIIIFFIFFEAMFFLMVYCFGPKSLKTMYDICRQQEVIKKDIANLEAENNKLVQLIEYHKTDFAKEKIAREVLSMKKSDDTVYLLQS